MIPWTIAHQAPLSVGFSGKSGLPFPPPGNLPDPGMEPMSSALSGRVFTTAAAAKSLQSCPTLCDPIEAAHEASPSLGFSRQEHWSELPFPSPMQESEK